MKFAIVVFPGSTAITTPTTPRSTCSASRRSSLAQGNGPRGADAVILPGGFSHGDYLRTGAIARFSPVMGGGRAFAAQGGPVLGICNGFQILLEAGLLPGAMLRNAGSSSSASTSICAWSGPTRRSRALCTPGQVLRLPIAHGEGNYFARPDVVSALEANHQVVFRYATAAGEVTGGRESERLAQQHRRDLQRRRGTSSG